MKSAYFHSVGGASGDMILGALIDAGLPITELQKMLESMRVGGFSLRCTKSKRGGVSGTHVDVQLDETERKGRTFQDFVEIVEGSSLPAAVVEKACRVFLRLADAEGRVHRIEASRVNPHELGTLDTLVDVVGSVAGLHLLGVGDVYASPLPTGSGTVKTSHGILPVPVPATSELLSMSKAPVYGPSSNVPPTGEVLTPTGAAILTTLARFESPVIRVKRIGYGLGSRDPESFPNVLGLWLGCEVESTLRTKFTLLETNVDDATGEELGFVHEKLFALGARDVWFTPVYMKKNRPGNILSAIIAKALESEAVKLIMTETSTFGVRTRPLTRYEADRTLVEVNTTLGMVKVKTKFFDGERIGIAPEYEDCRRVALEKNIPIHDVFQLVQREAEKLL